MKSDSQNLVETVQMANRGAPFPNSHEVAKPWVEWTQTPDRMGTLRNANACSPQNTRVEADEKLVGLPNSVRAPDVLWSEHGTE